MLCTEHSSLSYASLNALVRSGREAIMKKRKRVRPTQEMWDAAYKAADDRYGAELSAAFEQVETIRAGRPETALQGTEAIRYLDAVTIFDELAKKRWDFAYKEAYRLAATRNSADPG
jgi:hypothetical protein